MLERWLQAATEEAGAGGADPSLLGQEAVDSVLDLAREAAHGVARPAAPLAAFAAGLALGRTNGSLDDLRQLVQRLSAMAEAWPPEQPLA
jgi:uncharacterized protein DUF6457